MTEDTGKRYLGKLFRVGLESMEDEVMYTTVNVSRWEFGKSLE